MPAPERLPMESWRECPRHSGSSYRPGLGERCTFCDVERYAAAADKEREARIEEQVEVWRRVIPLIVAALRAYDKESRV